MARGRKKLLCINYACPNLGLPYGRECAYATPMHGGVIARVGEWETQATGGYEDLPPHRRQSPEAWRVASVDDGREADPAPQIQTSDE